MFCGEHLRAPATQRGGWLSAERRRRTMGGGMQHEPIDASNIVRRLWVGGKPPFDRDFPGFDTLVLCAEELQPERVGFSGTVIRCPIPDSLLDTPQTLRAVHVARQVAGQLADGKTVLVTCAAGLNRSALVAAMALGYVTTMSSKQIVELIRRQRSSKALFNRAFIGLIEKVVDAQQRRRRR